MSPATPGDAFVAFERVQKSYDGLTLVVKDLNLTIGKGEFLTMLGPSGSGKTTCLMMLAGFETATHGEIRLDGRPINNIDLHARGRVSGRSHVRKRTTQGFPRPGISIVRK